MQIIPSRIQRMANERPLTLLSLVGVGAAAWYFYKKGSFGSIVDSVKNMVSGDSDMPSTSTSTYNTNKKSGLGSSFNANRNTGAGVSENRASGAV